MNLILLIVGCFMDTTPAILVLAPILLPVATSIGLDPIHFGLIMVTNLAIGFITPPLGINLFVASRISDSPMEVILKGIVAFIIIMLIDLMLITFIPEIVMFLPNLMK
ncbi:TRAP transporter large permease subunit [Succinatimonas hippei]|uniref:TRAP transporter large permease subunit n=1 Tax=Succinatimonas hippei TaxID=626938 RepID=UPI00255CF165|nr:TRAP transporter large permease subunit [Succinatimonas hippei]